MIEPTKDTIGMSMHFNDADPVIVCLVRGCKKHFHGDSRMDVMRNWTTHVGDDHREDWDEDVDPWPFHHYRKIRIDRLEFGSQQFGHSGRHNGAGTLECPAYSHHHCDPFCQMPTIDEIIMAGLDPRTFKPRSRGQ